MICNKKSPGTPTKKGKLDFPEVLPLYGHKESQGKIKPETGQLYNSIASRIDFGTTTHNPSHWTIIVLDTVQENKLLEMVAGFGAG
jgi:hypothetical protein